MGFGLEDIVTIAASRMKLRSVCWMRGCCFGAARVVPCKVSIPLAAAVVAAAADAACCWLDVSPLHF